MKELALKQKFEQLDKSGRLDAHMKKLEKFGVEGLKRQKK
jgi:hypothetical protein